MKTNIFPLFLFIALPGVLTAGEARILSMSGNVEVRQTREGQWTSASENMEVAEGGAVRTGSDGAAVLLMPNKTKVWFKEATTLEIEQRQTLASRLALMFGKVKIRVPHLLRKEKFEVRTPAAVCAVRGTEFTMGAAEDGKMDLQVLFGEVKLKFTVPQVKGKSEFNIPQGQGLSTGEKGKPVKPVLLTANNERAALENWNPGVKPEDRQNELKQKENDRAQVKEFAKVTNGAEQTVKTFLNVVKESDLEAGRTLNDVHGNLVRVDQRMVRPAPNEIQFFNLVKRPAYANYTSDARGFAYNGGAVANRLDYMQMTMAFNKDLPQRIEEWPSFFNANSVDPSWASFVTANRTKAGEIFFIAQGYKYDAARDELVNNPWVIDADGAPSIPTTSVDDRQVIMTGVLRDNAELKAVDGLNRITSLRVMASGADPGRLIYKDGTFTNNVGYDASLGDQVVWAIKTDNAVSYSVPKNAPDNAPLAQFQADMYQVGNGGATYLWFAKENYVISNGGQIRTPNDFTKTSSDPFTLLKENALESVMYIKKSLNNDPATILTNQNAKDAISNEDFFAYKKGDVATNGVGTNIDIVFIPDLMVAAVQRMLPAITNLKD